MKAFLRNLVLGGFFIFMVAAPVLAVATPQTSIVAADPACESRPLGIPPWYRGLTGSSPDCNLISPNDAGGLGPFIWKIVLNIIEMVIVIVAYISVFFILYGGFQFLVGGSNPGMIEKARKTILNAVIGLVIAMGAIGITNLIFSIIS